MAFGTIWTKCIVVHIGMTGSAFAFSLPKFQGLMAAFTVNRLVLTSQPEFGGIVVKSHLRFIHFPAGGIMAGGTINFKLSSVRRLSKNHCSKKNEYD